MPFHLLCGTPGLKRASQVQESIIELATRFIRTSFLCNGRFFVPLCPRKYPLQQATTMVPSSVCQDEVLETSAGQRKLSRIRILTPAEMATLGFYALVMFLGLGGAVFFAARQIQGYRHGFLPYYLDMLFVVSACSLVCHVFLVKRRLDYDLSTVQLAGVIPSPVHESRSLAGCFSACLNRCSRFFHAYTVFLASLFVVAVVLFDLATGYTVSHFRPAHLARTISLAAFQCVLVGLAFAWFLVALSLSSSNKDVSFSRGCTGRTQSIHDRIQLSESPAGEVIGSQKAVLNEIAVEMLGREDTSSGGAMKIGSVGQWGTGSAASEVSTTCPFAPGRGGSPQWEDSADPSDDNEAGSTSVQPCVIGVPSFAVVRATPSLAPRNEQ
ncbi:putative transmembrane protein [Toxoplasma gondii RUB]|uniref:Putative transmembrane protein n=1 Tax=Toxoplasma gondii RUB TaxID=935652 RepID=A0A086LMS7_TOXGO|nr:putative transmembrane protein [Toxoplasma gondii RUB]